jgi:glycosyltransferase involved in cell wall biosynthesis
VLEAMQRGTPVACSDIPVLREVGGDVPHYFDPHDPRDAARAIEAGLDSRRDGGRERAARFTWEAAAHGTWAAYERALAR